MYPAPSRAASMVRGWVLTSRRQMTTEAPRKFQWADLSALAELMDRARRADGDQRSMSLASLEEYLGQPGLAPEDNCHLFQSSSGLQAYALVHPELAIQRSVLEACIHPDHRADDLRTAVLNTGVKRAKELGARVLHFCVHQQDRSWTASLQSAGLAPARAYWLMRWDGEEPPATEVPDGFSIRSFRPGEGGVLAQVQNAAFRDSWGFSPNTGEETEYRAVMGLTGAGGIVFLNHGEAMAGYCWTSTESTREGPPIGTISMIGIHPSYRGRGLSKPILAAGMRHLVSRRVGYIKLDVDASNEPAVGLYSAVGFRKASQLQWFEARPSEA